MKNTKNTACKKAPSVKKTVAAPAVKKAAVARKAAKVVAPAPAKKPETKGCIKTERIVLTISAESGSKVYLAGSFNNWNETELQMTEKGSTGVFSTSVTLAPGIYEYKFIINGVWVLDPNPDRDWTQNAFGTLNSVLRVG